MKNSIFTLLSICLPISLFAQEFIQNPVDEMRIQLVSQDSTKGVFQFHFSDYDLDQDLDLFIIGVTQDTQPGETLENLNFFIDMQENIGDQSNMIFDLRTDIYPHFPFPRGVFYASTGDLNADGYSDYVAHGYINKDGTFHELVFCINRGESQPEIFDTLHAPYYELPRFLPQSYMIPSLMDLDQDGDLDLLVAGLEPLNPVEGTFQNVMYYAKNIGSVSEPNFLGWFENPYGLEPGQTLSLPTFLMGDLDMDGDQDLLSVSLSTDIEPIKYFENQAGQDGRPAFSTYTVSPFGLPAAPENHSFLAPALADTDGDGDLDFLIIHDDGDNAVLEFYENQSCIIQVTALAEGTTLIAQVADTEYQWIDCTSGAAIAGATNQIFEPDETGSYAVRIIDGNGCMATSDCIQLVITGIEGLLAESQLMIYPNPASDRFYIKNENDYSISQIEVFDVFGKQRIELEKISENYINVSGLSPGVYLVRIELQNAGEVLKMILIE
jgi:hypothetical protein